METDALKLKYAEAVGKIIQLKEEKELFIELLRDINSSEQSFQLHPDHLERMVNLLAKHDKDVPQAHAENPFRKEWPESSMIESTEYIEENQHLDVTFKNKSTYRYYGVPLEIWEELKSAESIGKYINKKIKGSFQSQSMDGPAKPLNIHTSENDHGL